MDTSTSTRKEPSARVSWETLHAQIASVKSNISFKELSTAKSENIFILNTHRQIVFITRSGLDLFQIEDPSEAYGCRPGEMMGCDHARANGCGESEECKECGAYQAALACLQHNSGTKRFHLKQADREQTIDFTVHTEAISLQGELFIMVSLIQD
ncbi:MULTISPECIES: hypothetical protein [unclassified Lentimonas]|uniref:hypothetical protein n=1 Tax=unclassified Lentimonas TaxID=2630993 RepID=UPI00132A9CA4|nr:MULTISPECIES: hypothetical protein [unclassified Lentimonas]CAA6680282.1 Unannotated [Lentimonas sp. CC4]CAA6685575.1 Unannotated [Lentimonas sp. CC6]CAA6689680.1 Unannotated [Lentimonas sp. CC19]CAA6692708.1 Unannotated [Lentimonas sp. CC10]CAA7069269.1 Unannotated [Lentimonas sp. CC11]